MVGGGTDGVGSTGRPASPSAATGLVSGESPKQSLCSLPANGANHPSVSPQRGDRLPQVRGLHRAVIRYWHCSTPRHLCIRWHFNHPCCDNQCQHQSKPSLRAAACLDPGVPLPAVVPMQTAPVSRERCWTMARHQQCQARELNATLAWGLLVQLLFCYGAIPSTLWLSDIQPAEAEPWARQGESRAGGRQDGGTTSSSTAAKLSPCRLGIDTKTTQKNGDVPYKTQFLSVPHENPCVAAGQEGGSSVKARESIESLSAAQGEAVARQK